MVFNITSACYIMFVQFIYVLDQRSWNLEGVGTWNHVSFIMTYMMVFRDNLDASLTKILVYLKTTVKHCNTLIASLKVTPMLILLNSPLYPNIPLWDMIKKIALARDDRLT